MKSRSGLFLIGFILLLASCSMGNDDEERSVLETSFSAVSPVFTSGNILSYS